jgi:hypothetical protein
LALFPSSGIGGQTGYTVRASRTFRSPWDSGVPRNIFRGFYTRIFFVGFTPGIFSGFYTRNFFGGFKPGFFRGVYTRNFFRGLH